MIGTLHAVIDEEMLMRKVDDIYGRMVILYAGAILIILLILFCDNKSSSSPR